MSNLATHAAPAAIMSTPTSFADMPEPRQIEQIAARETELFLAEQARQFITCAVNLAAHTTSLEAVARFLRELADQIEDYG